MRKILRPPVACPTLGAQGMGGKLADKLIREEPQHGGKELSFPGHWNEPDVRGALYAMHGRVCAYCQSHLPQNDPGDVEHFRPKSTYWWLAYSFTNYLLSCGTCNQVRKRELFRLPQGAIPIPFANRDQLQNEVFLLLDPASDPVEDWIRVNFEDPVCKVLFGDAVVAGTLAAARIDETIGFFKLNEYVPLVRQRYETINDALKTLKSARSGDAAAQAEIRLRASRYRPHGMAIRQMLAELAPEWLPTADEELRWLIEDFGKDLDFAAKLNASHPGSKAIRKTVEEVCWALATLWKHPPAASAAQIEAWIAATGWRDLAADYHARLP